ncbi:Titin [Phytophthora ramorum]|uniref:Titin n=1 Tax=Phytophthora ramorum TaxID=164328 RepID=UPI0030A97396|nr:Titin [Phytophthora ramorum]
MLREQVSCSCGRTPRPSFETAHDDHGREVISSGGSWTPVNSSRGRWIEPVGNDAFEAVVDLYLVTDRSSATASTESLDVTLYGEEHVVLQTAELSSEILQKRISKVTLALDTEAAIKTVKIQAAARISLQIFEVQTSVNDLPPTIFSPPTPGSVTFVGSEETTSTGIVSLWFVPVTEYLKGAYRSQCLFDLVGRCGYHADLQESSDLLFLSEEGNELIVAAKSVAAPSFRRLTEVEHPPKVTPRSIEMLPTVAGRSRIQRTTSPSLRLGVALPRGDIMIVLPNEPVLCEIDERRMRGSFERLISGEAIYRSLPTQLQGNSTLSFSYQLSSDFSSISTDVILNSSETRRVWSSESAAINPSEWNIAVAPITLAYASTAEIIFRGVVAVEDGLYLKTIALRDYTQESTVGVVEYIRATGGMIYLEINTAESIPEPVWYRVYVKTLNSNESPALRFTGDGLQYLGANDEVAVLTNGVKVADGRLSKDNCNIPAYAYLQLGRDTMDVRSDASVLQGAMDEVRIWKVARDTLAVNASYQRNIADTDLILRLPFNSAEKTNWFPSGTDESGNSVDFMATGGSITLTMEEPLDTGGLPIARYNIFMLQDNLFSKITSVEASSTNEITSTTVTRDVDDVPLRALTDYTFKVLALQADVVCDTLTEEGLESDAVTKSTGFAAIPAPPPRPSLLQLAGCTAVITATPPNDYGGTQVTGMTVGVFLSTGVLYASFAVALDAGTITVPSLLANTSYFVKVSLKTTVGDSEFGEAQSFTTGEPSQPGKFARLKIDNIGSSSLSLSWAGPLNSGGGTVSGYLVYQRTSKSSELVYNGSDDSNTTSYLIRGLLAETLRIDRLELDTSIGYWRCSDCADFA